MESGGEMEEMLGWGLEEEEVVRVVVVVLGELLGAVAAECSRTFKNDAHDPLLAAGTAAPSPSWSPPAMLGGDDVATRAGGRTWAMDGQ